jgi:hypothetical protein
MFRLKTVAVTRAALSGLALFIASGVRADVVPDLEGFSRTLPDIAEAQALTERLA